MSMSKVTKKRMSQKITRKASSLGQVLRSARQQRGIHLGEASTALHIPYQQLEALETDSAASVFPAPVYAFGALRTYAAWLEVDSRPLERILAAQLRAARVERSRLHVHTLPYWYERFITARTIIAAGGVVIALIVSSYVIWQVRSFWRLPLLEITSPESMVTQDDRVVVSGQTEEGAHVKINEHSVALQDGSYFEQEIPLSPGITIVRVEAENVAGRVRTIERHLLRPANAGTLR